MYTSFCLFSGLKLLSTITNQRQYDLRIDFSGINGMSWHIKYCNFKVGSEYNNYTLTLGHGGTQSRNARKCWFYEPKWLSHRPYVFNLYMGVSFLALSKITFLAAIFWNLMWRENIYVIAIRSQIIFLYFWYDKWSGISDKIIRVF